MDNEQGQLMVFSQCRNCSTQMTEVSSFCACCGAKVIRERITVKGLLANVAQTVLGWDNTYFVTIRHMLAKPGVLLRAYMEGTRKRYMNPFSFLLIGMTLAIFTFNSFDEHFVRMNQDVQKSQMEWMAETLGGPYASAEFQEEQLADSESAIRFQLKYFNLLTVLLLPLYTYLAFLVYGRPYNFAEHLVVNSYVQGVSFLSITLFFMLSLVTHPFVYMVNFLFLVWLYTYAYGKLYNLSLGQSLLKVFVFLALLLVFIMGIAVISVAAGFLIGYLG
ncbi:DUF3667 domain-containing protein [Maribacter sp. 2307ULW6-5]|uniref:DUF3667 domain-containing protein n=1 Tax=Maribacter sp. 2307ULW6-5 TaxID=3386275 RepID=UPI0039BD7ECC